MDVYKNNGFVAVVSSFDYCCMQHKITGRYIIVDRNTGLFTPTNDCIADVSMNKGEYLWLEPNFP